MLVGDMHTHYKVLLDKIDSNAYPLIKPEEIDLYLNIAQDNFVINTYNGSYTSSPTATMAFEETGKRLSDLSSVINDFQRKLSNLDYNKYNVFNNTYQISNKDVEDETDVIYWFKVRELFTLHRKDIKCGDKTIALPVENATNDSIGRTEIDPFNLSSPYFPRTLHKDYIEIFTGGEFDYTKYDITYRLRFIRKPARISKKNNVSCELYDETHQKIVRDAVGYTLETIESPRFQTQFAVNKTLE